MKFLTLSCFHLNVYNSRTDGLISANLSFALNARSYFIFSTNLFYTMCRALNIYV